MAKLITVHGTGAGASADEGAIWWQLGSPFMTSLGRILDMSQVEVIPFHWDIGANSERQRRDAGKRLYEQLKALDAAGQDYYVLGHSHGGSVIYNALLLSAVKSKRLQRLQAWFTVGSPFIDIAPRRLLALRLSPPGLAVYALGVALLIAALALIGSHLVGTELTRLIDEKLKGAALAHLYAPILMATCVLAAATYALLYVYDRLSNRWISDKAKRKAAELYAGSWIGLAHADDEAIAALRAASSFKPEIIPRNFLARPFSMIPIVAMTLGLFFIIWKIEGALGLPLDRLQSLVKGIQDSKVGQFHLSYLPNIGGLISWSLVMLFVLAVATAVVYVFQLVGTFLGRPLAGAIDRLVWASVRDQAWGDDLDAEAVRGVSSHPPMFALRYKPLPASVADPISKLADGSAGETLKKLRSTLGITATSARSGDLFTTALNTLSWRELVHTAYFDIESFTRLVAHAMHRHGLAGLRADAWTTEQRTAAHQAFVDMTIRNVANAGDVERVGDGQTVARDNSLDLSVSKKIMISLGMVLAVFVGGMLLTSLVIPWQLAALIWFGGAVLIIALAELIPVSTRGLTSIAAPTGTFEAAEERFRSWISAPEATIHPRCVPFLLHHGKRVPRAYVLVHGVSNCPYSMVEFAPKLHALGHNVLVVRMPQNGHLDNATDALRRLTAVQLRSFADQSLDIAAGLGERVHVIGISAGGVIAGWMAQNRPEIDRAVLLAPAYGLSSFGMGWNNALMRLILGMPNFSVWKDPIERDKAENRPHSYKRQSTRGMGEIMRLGLATIRQARRSRPAATAVTLVTNAADAAVDPSIPAALTKRWEATATPVTRYVFPKELNLPHELIDATESGANTAISHPKIIELAERAPEVRRT